MSPGDFRIRRRKRGLKRTWSFLFLPFYFTHSVRLSHFTWEYILFFYPLGGRAITDFPVASASHSVLNMVESNHKCNQLFVTYFNIRQRIHRFLKGFWATEKSVNFSVHFTLRLFSKKWKWIREIEIYLPSTANHNEVISYGWGAREIVVCIVINNVEQTLPNLSGRTHEPLILRLKLQGFFVLKNLVRMFLSWFSRII